jgi:NAD+-dependent protein deacetylase SIR2
MALMAKQATVAVPTPFHQLLGMWRKSGLLKRLYTQNIDGIEAKIGFDLSGSQMSDTLCIQLHGTILQLRCHICHSKEPVESYFDVLQAGSLPQCNVCRIKASHRLAAGHRPHAEGLLRPNVLLYGEENMDEVIMNAVQQDLTLMEMNQVLLVVGTTLHIPGVKQVTQEIAKVVKIKQGQVIYLDLQAEQLDIKKTGLFTNIVKADCQAIATEILARIDESKKTLLPLHQYTQEVETRMDWRPLWDWN